MPSHLKTRYQLKFYVTFNIVYEKLVLVFLHVSASINVENLPNHVKGGFISICRSPQFTLCPVSYKMHYQTPRNNPF